MAHIKRSSPTDWVLDRPAVSAVKIPAGGLRGHDRRTFLKRAGVTGPTFLPFLETKFAADEEPLHVLAVGADERFGANRNGDAFPLAGLLRRHDTFVKHARFYRSHINKADSPSYGLVKASAVNPDMGWTELLIALNREKSAADRNGGFVADLEMQKLGRTGDLPVSMSCKVAEDRCSACGNLAKTADDYCTSRTCVGGGCKDYLGQLRKYGGDIHLLHVKNDDPWFFDISHVFRPADRIAYGARADWTKSASDRQAPLALSVAQLADDPELALPAKIAEALIAIHAAGPAAWPTAAASAFSDRPAVKAAQAGPYLAALADRGAILPIESLASLLELPGSPALARTKIAAALTELVDRGELGTYVARAGLTGDPRREIHKSAAELADRCSLLRADVTRRAIVGRPPASYPEMNGADAPSLELARTYAGYKVAALTRILDRRTPLESENWLLRAAVLQDRA